MNRSLLKRIEQLLVDILIYGVLILIRGMGIVGILLIVGTAAVILVAPLFFVFGIKMLIDGNLVSGAYLVFIGGTSTFILTVVLIWSLREEIVRRRLNKFWRLFADQFGLKFEQSTGSYGAYTLEISGIYRNHNIWLNSHRPPTHIEVDLGAINYDGSIQGINEEFYRNDHTNLYVDLNNLEGTPTNDDKLKRTFDSYIQNKSIDLEKTKTCSVVNGKKIHIYWPWFIKDKEKLQLVLGTIIDIVEYMEKNNRKVS